MDGQTSAGPAAHPYLCNIANAFHVLLAALIIQRAVTSLGSIVRGSAEFAVVVTGAAFPIGSFVNFLIVVLSRFRASNAALESGAQVA